MATHSAPMEVPWTSGKAMKLACRNNGGESEGYVHVTSADSCRMTEIEGVRMLELVYLGVLFRMGGDSLVMLVWVCWRWVHRQ